MQAGDLSVNARNYRIRHRVATEGKAEVIRGSHEHILYLGCDLVVHIVQAEIQVLELRTSLQEPVNCLVAISIAGQLVFKRVKDGHRLIRLFLLLQLFVLLDDGVSFLQLALISLDLVSREWYLAEAVKNW